MPDVFVSPDRQTHKGTPSPQKNLTEEGTKKLFSSFNLYPSGIDFETREDKEKIILMLRQHPVVNVKWIFTTLLLLTGPTFLSIFGIFSLLPEGFSLVITLAWYLVTSAYAIEGFLNWYFNVYFVTTEEIIDVDFFNLLGKRVSVADLDKIQDVSYSTHGVLGTVLNFGDVQIQTAAEITEFRFESVPSPERVAKFLDDLIDKY
ncbi:MAG: hypothetical protein UV71_C0001G0110 [Microgenomates group bacterium GW2011_GWC1_43_13]|uniref:YdbS-like PH domain-containing protein n=2 Tax=Candidatus Woeseibacteriota TaxID=1752722 RepID=A0A837IC80_9BACT|nr:MAG: hypothetical protein UV71_C0001G0110 [Microgenomates group bacterium GW2011_GWC1_43_13]KKT32855.1 MAG: hypothetical protein UW20_C0008G0029 [Candidatus Woesebacteria bacterium GW2011_GWB1_44_11]KKT54652.1 MAG: hypothetical protein UW47_C0004G0059 [Candidatus Woesebacteria bacterium GW2011_GWA1_44_23]OGM75970.1 MAG: hypothetical protein A2208_00280 [Candidatus Woesebacteria bacterium RIFOXYA1_FULL_43_16]OGM81417.1 MAG: hypothetical protein A2394_03405 [Candidatus Woesebacteria bacterium 